MKKNLQKLRETYKKIQERKETLENPIDILYLNNLYEIFAQEVWELLGERKEDQ